MFGDTAASTQDRHWMGRAMELARATTGLASPNPQVGCVLVRDEQVLAEGAHRYADRDHAEIVALKQAATLRRPVAGATAYVTLEPCSHHGRTGPCADALAAAGISRCVVATADPNPLVSGQGLAKLRAAGVEITLGVCELEARQLNEAFAESIVWGRPFVTLKAGLSIDGFLAPQPALRSGAAPHWLTGPESRAEVQRMRHASDAVLTGIGTVLADDPLLTDRSGLPRRRPLMRVVLDSRLQIPLRSSLLQQASGDIWIFCSRQAQASAEKALADQGVRVTRVATNALRDVLAHLHEEHLLSVLLETGSTLNAAFLRQDLVDRVTLFYAEAELGRGSVPFALGGTSSFELERHLRSVTKQAFGADVRVSGLLHDPWADSRATNGTIL